MHSTHLPWQRIDLIKTSSFLPSSLSLPGQIEKRLEVDVGDAQRTRVMPESVDPCCLAGKALHRIALRKNGRIFGDECFILTWLVKVVEYTTCRGEAEECVE